MEDKPDHTAEIKEAIESLEYTLSDDGGMVRAIAEGCKAQNSSTAPIMALLSAREKLLKIKTLICK